MFSHPHEPGPAERRSSIAPGLKLAGVLVFCAVIALLPRTALEWHLLPSLLIALAWWRARMPLVTGLHRLLPVEFFLVGLAVVVLLRPETQGVFLATAVKSHLCMLAMLLLAYTTAEHELVAVARRWRVPGLLVTLLALLVRYLPVLREESGRMQRARSSRTFSAGRRVQWGALGEIVSELYLRSSLRAERIHQAMSARGWK